MDFFANINWLQVLMFMIIYNLGYWFGFYFARRQTKKFYLELINKLPEAMKDTLYTELGKKELNKDGKSA